MRHLKPGQAQRVGTSTLDRELLPGTENGKRESHLHIAVVSTADGVQEVIVSQNASRMWSRLAEYLRENASTKLLPEDACVVQDNLKRGRMEAAAELYFRRVGLRWDRERLHLEMVELS